jgi:hypothetical protein
MYFFFFSSSYVFIVFVCSVCLLFVDLLIFCFPLNALYLDSFVSINLY